MQLYFPPTPMETDLDCLRHFILSSTMTSTTELPNCLMSMLAIVGMGNPRNIGKSKKVLFDAQCFLGAEKCDALFGVVSYFNTSDLFFPPDKVGLYLISCTVSISISIILTVY
jgi:hypothetical protein